MGDGRIVGYGQLIVDHVFVRRDHSLVYRGAVGGGSVPNALATAARREHALGVLLSGSDELSEFGINQLLEAGVEVEAEQQAGRRTRQMFQVPTGEHTPLPDLGDLYRTTSKCPVCLTSGIQATAAVERPPRSAAISGISDADVFLADKPTQAAVTLAKTLAPEISILDLGHLGHLRFKTFAETVAILRGFDVVFTGADIAQAIAKRGQLTDLGQLADLGPSHALIVSAGAQGLELYLSGRSSTGSPVSVAAPKSVDVLDNVGAGDAFVGEFAARLIKSERIEDADLVAAATAAVDDSSAVLTGLGARHHLGQQPQAVGGLAPFIGLSLEEIRANMTDACRVCRSSLNPQANVQPASKPGARRNVSWLRSRMFAAVEAPGAISELSRVLADSGTAVAVGSGGSFPVAQYISELISHDGRWFSRPLKPYDYCQFRPRVDLVVAVTYSGKTKDIGRVIEAAHETGSRVVLLTGSPQPALANSLSLTSSDSLVSYGRRSRRGGAPMERGFVSIAGTVLPCAVALGSVVGRKAIVELAETFTNDAIEHDSRVAAGRIHGWLRDDATLEVFSSGWSGAASVDLESKFVEGDLGTVRQHEAKDFSHGRFMSVLRNRHEGALLLAVAEPTSYESKLEGALRKTGPVETIRSNSSGPVGGLELLIRTQFLVEALASLRGVDISRPKEIPQAGLRLYRW